MELLNLFLICFGFFGFFAIIEVIKLKKEVRKLNGIVRHLLKNENEAELESLDDWYISLFSVIKFNKITISLIVYNSFKLYPNIWVNILKTIFNHCKQNGK